ncbi:hypothetical protein SAMN04488544_2576 [Microlunatus sagamiharensis]|uniref:Uncharacterized protein n=1 Tax=Microlunatus sagamiharensis TaxID=546874 RepID=A0A1H2MS85_9ACTN|nr:hypothetical protein [Microlunatus sagamiharensis]SDU95811.1 hypothetical protein SAMN04488544_2576 [Microlunatus sagamiharensis]
MPDVSRPSCGHTSTPAFTPASPSSVVEGSPDPSVVRWFRLDPAWLGELSTDALYGGYLRATTGAPVSRARFVADLAHLGVEEVLDDDTRVLVRA